MSFNDDDDEEEFEFSNDGDSQEQEQPPMTQTANAQSHRIAQQQFADASEPSQPVLFGMTKGQLVGVGLVGAVGILLGATVLANPIADWLGRRSNSDED